MRYTILLIALCGCGTEAIEVAVEEPKPPQFTVTIQDVANKQDAAAAILKDNTAALARIEKSLEASLSAPKPNGQEVIKSAPNPPAKANTAPAPIKVATPGDFSEPETLVELATRLYASGVNVHNKTREELEAIDAQMQGVKSSPVQYQSRPTYLQPTGTVCVNGRCFVPQVSTRRRR